MDTAPVIVYNDSWQITLTPEQWHQSEYLATYREDDAEENPDETRVDVLDNTLKQEDMSYAVNILTILARITELRTQLSHPDSFPAMPSLVKDIVKNAYSAQNILKRRDPHVAWVFPDHETVAYVERVLQTQMSPREAYENPEIYKDPSLFLIHNWSAFERIYINGNPRRAGMITTLAKELCQHHPGWCIKNLYPLDVFKYYQSANCYLTPSRTPLSALLTYGGPEMIRWWWSVFGGPLVVKRVATKGKTNVFPAFLLTHPQSTPELIAEFEEIFSTAE